MDQPVSIPDFLSEHNSLHERVQARTYGTQISVNVVDCEDASLGIVLSELKNIANPEMCIALQLLDCKFESEAVKAISNISQQVTLLSMQCRVSKYASCDDIAKAVSMCQQLQILIFEDMPLGDYGITKIVQAVTPLTSLTTLGLEGIDITHVGMGSIMSLFNAPYVTCTTCGSYVGTITCLNVLWVCKSCQRTHKMPATSEQTELIECCNETLGESGGMLHHRCCGDEHNHGTEISNPGTSRIVNLSLSRNTFSNSSAVILAETLCAYVGITNLSVRDTGLLNHQAFLDVLQSKNQTFTSLDLSDNHMDVPNKKKISKLLKALSKRSTKLKSLSLARLTPPIVYSLLQTIAQCENLVTLDISGNEYPKKAPETSLAQVMSSLGHLKHLNISDCGIPQQMMREMAAVVHQSASPGLYSSIDISGNEDIGEVATLWSSIPGGTIDVLLRTVDLSGSWTVSAGNCPPKKDVSYTLIDVVHDKVTHTITGVLPGANNTWNCTGSFRSGSVTMEIDWRGGRTSRFVLRMLPAPPRPLSPYLYHESCQRIHMVGTLFNDYDYSQGDVAVIVTKPRQKWSQRAANLFGQ